MEQARTKLADLGHRVLVDREHITVTRHGRPFFVLVPPDWHTEHQGDAMNLSSLDRQLRAAVDAGDDQALAGLADEIEQAGLPLLAEDVRTRKSAGLRDLLRALGQGG